MKLIHHVKKHGKTITLHLKKHHKKYIFGILSATLLWKGVSLIAAYALVHNLSFSFADTVHQGESNNEDVVVEETIIDNEQEDGAQEDGIQEDGIQGKGNEENRTQEDGAQEKGIQEDGTQEDGNEEDGIQEDGAQEDGIQEDGTQEDGNEEDGTQKTILRGDDGNNGDDLTPKETKGNGTCDRGDIVITSPVGGDIVGGTFKITWEFRNNDCLDTEYTIKLRTQSGQMEIFSGNSESTQISFDSTQLEPDYYTLYNLTIYGNDNNIYREAEGNDFTIDNRTPILTNTGVEYSTRNNKLNIGDTVTVSFESDEELSGVTVNIQGRTAYLEEKDGNKYKYTMEFSENNTTGKIVYGIDYSDMVGNTGYYERYDNKELDYTAPTIENISMTNSGNEIRLTFDTDEITDSYLVYMISGAKYTNSLNSNNKTGHEFILNNISNKLVYNYSISIEDEAKNKLNIGGNFYISGDKVVFTNKEIRAGDLITEVGFKTGDEQELKDKLNSFDKCAEDIKFINMNLPIDGMTGKLVMPSFSNSSVNQMTNAFTTLLVKRIDGKAFSQRDLDEIFEDLNNFLIVVKLVKDDNNACKQNMSQYYINRFKKTLIKYKLINN